MFVPGEVFIKRIVAVAGDKIEVKQVRSGAAAVVPFDMAEEAEPPAEIGWAQVWQLKKPHTDA